MHILDNCTFLDTEMINIKMISKNNLYIEKLLLYIIIWDIIILNKFSSDFDKLGTVMIMEARSLI